MIKALQQVFPTLLHHSNVMHSQFDQNYQWFVTPEQEIIGISKQELSEKDIAILASFLEPYDIQFPLLTEKEQAWEKRIHNETNEVIENNYRFVYFSIPNKQIDPHTFKDAMNDIFEKEVSILWENEQEGIIIEEKQDELADSTLYEQIIDVVMSDLYMKINFLVGPFQVDLSSINRHYHYILQCGKIAFTQSNKNVLTYLDAIPYLFVNQAHPQFKQEITKNVLHEFVDDPEFQKMIETFLQCNLNISVTAKKLYMHRNSLQYRFDKFHEQTSIDIRDFHQAMNVYLALLAKQ